MSYPAHYEGGGLVDPTLVDPTKPPEGITIFDVIYALIEKAVWRSEAEQQAMHAALSQAWNNELEAQKVAAEELANEQKQLAAEKKQLGRGDSYGA